MEMPPPPNILIFDGPASKLSITDKAKKYVPNNFACVKAAANPNYIWAISFMDYAKNNSILTEVGVTDRDTCMAKRDQIANAAEKIFPGIGRLSVNSAGECLCKQVYY